MINLLRRLNKEGIEFVFGMEIKKNNRVIIMLLIIMDIIIGSNKIKIKLIKRSFLSFRNKNQSNEILKLLIINKILKLIMSNNIRKARMNLLTAIKGRCKNMLTKIKQHQNIHYIQQKY